MIATTPSEKKVGLGEGIVNGSRLEKFFADQLRDIYWAEKHLVKTMPKIKKAATSSELQIAIEDHLIVTKEHVLRLEQIFELLGKKPKAKKCDAIRGIIDEAACIIEKTDDGTATRDAGIILAAQKVEHYEIATYAGLAHISTTLGYAEITKLLKMTLYEEKEADEALTDVAENNINYLANEEGDDIGDEY